MQYEHEKRMRELEEEEWKKDGRPSLYVAVLLIEKAPRCFDTRERKSRGTLTLKGNYFSWDLELEIFGITADVRLETTIGRTAKHAHTVVGCEV